MRNGYENENMRSLLPTERLSAKKGLGRHFVDTSMKLDTNALETILINFRYRTTSRNHFYACAMATKMIICAVYFRLSAIAPTKGLVIIL